MSRDYANRKPKTAKKPRATRGKKAQPQRRKPYGLFLMVLVFAGVFGYFLWWLKSPTTEPAAPAIKTPVVIEQPNAKPVKKDDLPPKPEQKWTYQEELKNKQIEVDIPESEKLQVKLYQMQCGSFRKESQAQTLKARIAFQGFEAQVKRTEGTTGLWYKVVMGPYEGKRLAETQNHKLQKDGINGCQIWLWQ
ncbi:SPOR domain-containing protein [Shewanella intestini]|uniref:Sporulation protein n=1 Tax=Shewanella intestini TaxID=2017544 RepID=A0ABS5I4X6_9GAMM|nr:SPOR domain-containing protein [Shewanella intestini]MBR9729079.1 sporulation protein [Shewanella intestini]MRG37155.1 sporulation protein [Shewanella sp. XMDDZSB0408]